MPRQSQTQSTSNRKQEQRVEVKIKGQILYCSTHLKQSTYSTHNTLMISTSPYSLRKIAMKICFSSRVCLQAATPTARCCGSSDHLLLFSRWLKPGILLRGGCKHRANQGVCNGLFWIANEAKLQRWSPAKTEVKKKEKEKLLPFDSFQKPQFSVRKRRRADRWDPSPTTPATSKPRRVFSQREADSEAATIWRSSSPRGRPSLTPQPPPPHPGIWLL